MTGAEELLAKAGPPSFAPTTVLAVVADAEARALLPRVLGAERLLLASDAAEALHLAAREKPEIAFVDVGLSGGAGLALVHHIKAVAPEASVFALATPETLEAAANAVALGGAGVLMLPLGGDELENAVATARARRAEGVLRAELRDTARYNARAASWLARAAELAEAPNRTEATRLLAMVLLEATGARHAAIFVPVAEGSAELSRAFASRELERAPTFGASREVLRFAQEARLLVVPLATRKHDAGYALLSFGDGIEGPPTGRVPAAPGTVWSAPAAVGFDGLLRLVAAQAAVALTLLAERERGAGGGLKDPTSSAYSFGYYADVAGREIDRARRHDRRFAIATILVDPAPADPGAGDEASASPAEIADRLLRTVRAADLLARVDEHEFHLLLTETDGLGAHTLRRRIMGRLGWGLARRGGAGGMLLGIATFPHDGSDLPRLLRVARSRAEASGRSLVRRVMSSLGSLGDVLPALERAVIEQPPTPGEVAMAWPVELGSAEAASLAAGVVADAVRGGRVVVAVTDHPRIGLGAAVHGAVALAPEFVALHAVDVRGSAGCEDLEAFGVLAEQGAYAFVGRASGGMVRGIHASDPLLVDVLFERLGRAAGLRVLR